MARGALVVVGVAAALTATSRPSEAQWVAHWQEGPRFGLLDTAAVGNWPSIRLPVDPSNRRTADLTIRPSADPLIRRTGGLTIRQSAEPPNRHFSWPKFIVGFFSSIAAHEATHFATSFVVGATPSLGFDKGRPVVHSGIDGDLNPHKQFAFSSSGMGMQLLLNELILWWPRGEGVAGEFERGILAGGIGTVLFYFTLGRNSPVGDVYWMDQTTTLSKWALTGIFGGVAATQVLRVVLRKRYMPFFWFPGPDGALNFGISY